MLIASIVLFFAALWFSLLNVVAIFRWSVHANVLGKEMIGTVHAKVPFNTVEAVIIVLLWTAFYAVRVLA